MKAIFFDRDGTVIQDGGYLYQPTEIKYFDDTFTALKNIQKLGFSFFMVTNQSGVGRKIFCEADVIKVYNHIQADLKKHKITPFLEMAYCPHAPDDDCECRKPKPYMINQLVKKWSIDTDQSYMIGDKVTDAECGVNAGVTGVLFGHTSSKYPSFPNMTKFYEYLKQHLG